MNATVKRTIWGAVYVAVLLAGLFVGGPLYLIIMLLAIAGMMNEFFNMTMHGRYRFSQVLTILSGLLLFALTYYVRSHSSVETKWLMLAFVPFFVVFCNSLFVKEVIDFGKFTYFYVSILYLVVPLIPANFLVFNAMGVYDYKPLLSILILVWSGDVGGYVFGCPFGKYGPKLAPKISPNKSWIGAIGGMLLTLASAYILSITGMLEFEGHVLSWYHALIMAGLVDVAGVCGDLVESQWKRYGKVKDSGNLIPGHGGLMDRLDSTIFAVPVAAIYLTLIGIL